VALLRYIEDNSAASYQKKKKGKGEQKNKKRKKEKKKVSGPRLSSPTGPHVRQPDRDMPVRSSTYSGDFFRDRGYYQKLAPMYAQIWWGIGGRTGGGVQWWPGRRSRGESSGPPEQQPACNGLSQLTVRARGISAKAALGSSAPRISAPSTCSDHAKPWRTAVTVP